MGEELPSGREEAKKLAGRLRSVGIWSATIAIDAVFLAAWALIYSVLEHRILEPMRLSGWDAAVLNVLRYVFGGSTLFVVLLYVVEDIIVMTRQAWQRIAKRERP